ncbi:sigma 54-interacting transcriptional regulator [Novipirellula artificiosorum]|uniref:Transcriptional regulatory protein ZraR n=1 Tax=Novipirellula artificiosorum TaxID=2528016 RepID=A0A5C6D2E0_9BACT|nr:sigma 54-interacting transcriptional regulator [Novipirellula artificiosorum]TWU31000.1 Transcriptional regulatory protein ZraR [Novipirellula artificiosorum]
MNTKDPAAPLSPATIQSGAYLVLQSAGRWSDVFRLVAPCEAFIGRASSNQIVIRSDQASRRHARIGWSAAGWVVEDLASRNGTFVNLRRIAEPTLLADGDKIGVAGFAIQFARKIESSIAGTPSGRLGVVSGGGVQQTTDDQITMELDADAITDRRRHSDYLHDSATEPGRSVLASQSSPRSTGTRPPSRMALDDPAPIRGDLLKLAFTLARLDEMTSAVQTALDSLVAHLQLDTAGVYIGDRVERPLPIHEMPLVATRQSGAHSYRRPPDALMENLTADGGNALLARNVLGDRELATENSRGQIDVESMILAPIRDHHDRTLGMIHLTTAGDMAPLGSKDLQFVVAVAEILAESASRLAEHQRLTRSLRLSRRRVDLLQQQLGDKVRIVGKSEAIRDVIDKVSLAAPTAATVLVRGESGVGKELVAAALHHASDRREGPLVCLNCAALSASLLESELFGHEKGAFTGATERKRGKFEMADGGTLMLDEIGEMNAELQAKLLRVLEGHSFERVGGHEPIRVDVRVVAATNRDLQAMVGEGTFRQDLYYRLDVVEIYVPPLRKREQDCLLLAEFFLKRFNLEMGRRIEGFTPAAQKQLLAYHWPGNIRELRNVVERAVVLNQKGIIDASDLALTPAESEEAARKRSDGPPVEMSLAELEQNHIERVLRHTDGNKSRAASILGIERSTLDRKLKKYSAG